MLKNYKIKLKLCKCYLSNHKSIIIWCIVGIIICISIPFILDRFLYNLRIYNSHLNSAEWSSFNGSYIGGIIGGVATLVGVLLSLKYTERKNKKSELNENSLIVYYDLMLGLSSLKKLYINYKNPNFKDIPSKIIFNREWMKSVTKITPNVNYTGKLYEFYGDLEIISQSLANKYEIESYSGIEGIQIDINKFGNIIKNASKKVFSKDFIERDMVSYIEDKEISIEVDINKDLNKEFKKVMDIIIINLLKT